MGKVAVGLKPEPTPSLAAGSLGFAIYENCNRKGRSPGRRGFTDATVMKSHILGWRTYGLTMPTGLSAAGTSDGVSCIRSVNFQNATKYVAQTLVYLIITPWRVTGLYVSTERVCGHQNQIQSPGRWNKLRNLHVVKPIMPLFGCHEYLG